MASNGFMIQRDFILRQIQMLVQALAQVLMKRQAGQHDEAEVEIRQALIQGAGFDLDALEAASRESAMAACERGGRFNPEIALATADLLREYGYLLEERGDERAAAAYRHTLWLYEAIRDAPGATRPYDLEARLAWLQERVVAET